MQATTCDGARWRRGALLTLALCAASSCASNPVQASRVELAELVRAHKRSAYDGGGLSARSFALVDRLGLDPAQHVAAIERLGRPVAGVDDVDRLLARAELFYARAQSVALADRAGLFLASARDAYAACTKRAASASGVAVLDPRRDAALRRHGYALTRFLTLCLGPEESVTRMLSRLAGFGIEIDWRRGGPWRLSDFDRAICSDTLRFEGLRHRFRRDGIGVPLVLLREPARGIPAYYPPEAMTRNATAVLRPGAGGKASRLEIYDPRTTRHLEILEDSRGPTLLPVAADFTAPFASLLARSDLHALEDRSFFSADADGHEGLFLLEDYDPSRQPVIMVHGLWSSPLTWRDLTNDVFGDETLQQRYQVWHYMYATGTPLLENARQLRATLRRARRELDPKGEDAATRHWILVGHGMGGLLSRMVLSSSGDAIWRTLFEGDFETVTKALDADDRALARDLYFWDALPFVRRAVFLAAPHRGSEVSDSWIGRLGSSLMRIPQRLKRLVDKIRSRAKVRVEVPTSVDELSISHPVIRTLAELEIAPAVVYHSIMGDVSESKDPADWTDSVVRYESSRLRGAASELVIRGADHSVHFDPRASAEVRRILRSLPRKP